MGMFDTVMVPCPKCGVREEFQSKSGDCTLAEYTLEDAPDDVLLDVNRHAPLRCRACGTQFAVAVSGVRPLRTLTARSVVWKDAESAQAFLHEIQRLHLLKETDRALDVIFGWIDNGLKRDAEEVDRALRDVAVSALDEDLIVGLLSSTFPARHLLKHREAFACRAREKLTQEIGGAATEALLRAVL